ncbi:hypothetical protein ACFE04_005940 [Oxalis oulophora]
MGNCVQPASRKTTLDQPKKQTEFTCQICTEPTSTVRKFRNKNLCSHSFCVDCVSKYIQLKILDNTAKIACPDLNCRKFLDPVANMSLISKPMFSKWCDLLCEDSVLDLTKCYCPNCSEMVVNERKFRLLKGCRNVTKSKCPNCKVLFCFKCQKKWHAGFSCEENEAITRDSNGILLGNLIKREQWQRCPACRHCVELYEDARHAFAIGVERGLLESCISAKFTAGWMICQWSLVEIFIAEEKLFLGIP